MTTLKIKRILFATDFLESSRLALDYAVAVAHHFGAEILMLHATEFPPAAHEAEVVSGLPSVSRKLAEQALDNLAKKVRRAGVRATTRVEEGTPSTVILNATIAEQFGLLVLGVHGIHRGLTHLLLGSNTERIVLAAPCPTLTVGAHVRAGVDLDLNLTGILYLAPPEERAALGASYAQRLAAAFNVPVETEYITDAADRDRVVREQMAQQDDDAREQDRPQPESGKVFHNHRSLRAGADADLLHRARTRANQMIVTMVSSESFFERHLRPSFAYELIANAVCPVITINAGLISVIEAQSRSPPG